MKTIPRLQPRGTKHWNPRFETHAHTDSVALASKGLAQPPLPPATVRVPHSPLSVKTDVTGVERQGVMGQRENT